MRKHHMRHLWLVLATYGVWFAIFSGLQEFLSGTVWKVSASIVFAIMTYIIIEMKLKKK